MLPARNLDGARHGFAPGRPAWTGNPRSGLPDLPVDAGNAGFGLDNANAIDGGRPGCSWCRPERDGLRRADEEERGVGRLGHAGQGRQRSADHQVARPSGPGPSTQLARKVDVSARNRGNCRKRYSPSYSPSDRQLASSFLEQPLSAPAVFDLADQVGAAHAVGGRAGTRRRSSVGRPPRCTGRRSSPSSARPASCGRRARGPPSCGRSGRGAC